MTHMLYQTAVIEVNVLFCCAGYIHNRNGSNRKHGEVRVGETKRRSKWQLFSVADWIWTWQFANGLSVSLLYMHCASVGCVHVHVRLWYRVAPKKLYIFQHTISLEPFRVK